MMVTSGEPRSTPAIAVANDSMLKIVSNSPCRSTSRGATRRATQFDPVSRSTEKTAVKNSEIVVLKVRPSTRSISTTQTMLGGMSARPMRTERSETGWGLRIGEWRLAIGGGIVEAGSAADYASGMAAGSPVSFDCCMANATSMAR